MSLSNDRNADTNNRMTTVEITGSPVATLDFFDVPSINVFASKGHFQKAALVKYWRGHARDKAEELLAWNEIYVRRALVIVNVFVPNQDMLDIHNVYVKPILDGITDAGLWVDDEWAFMPLFIYRWAGCISSADYGHKVRLTSIEVHELECLYVQGQPQPLPEGRTKKDVKQSNRKR